MIAELGLQEHFILAGNRNDVPAILQSCQIAFHASHGEAFSLSILEYMSAGLPTLAPNMCGNGEAIENGRTGFLYQPGNMQEVTEIIESLVRDEARRQSIGEAASRRVADFFTIGRMREEFVRLISTTL
jgi:glycosyltransferase involved in cell wall biosynthesis